MWVVATTDGTFYGQAMTADGIYQVAGGGATLGDGGPATSALLGNVGAVAVSPPAACWSPTALTTGCARYHRNPPAVN